MKRAKRQPEASAKIQLGAPALSNSKKNQSLNVDSDLIVYRISPSTTTADLVGEVFSNEHSSGI